jgi:hypothetical protein
MIRLVRVVERRELLADELGERGAVVDEEVGRVERGGAGGLGPEWKLKVSSRRMCMSSRACWTATSRVTSPFLPVTDIGSS